MHGSARGALPGALLGWILLGALPTLHFHHLGDVYTVQALLPINTMFAFMCLTLWLVLFLTHPYVVRLPLAHPATSSVGRQHRTPPLYRTYSLFLHPTSIHHAYSLCFHSSLLRTSPERRAARTGDGFQNRRDESLLAYISHEHFFSSLVFDTVAHSALISLAKTTLLTRRPTALPDAGAR